MTDVSQGAVQHHEEPIDDAPRLAPSAPAPATPREPTAPKTPQTAPDSIDEDEAFPRTIDEDEAFPPLTPEQQRKQVHAALGGSPLQDFLFGDEDLSEGIPIVGGSIASKLKHIGNVARATRDAFKEGFGPAPLVPSEEELQGVSKETVDYLKKHGLLKDYVDGQKEVSDAADTHLLKPTATEQALQSFLRGFVSNPAYQAGAAGIRGFNAAWHAAQHGIYSAGQEFGFPKLAADLAAYPESIMGSPHPTGIVRETPADFANRVMREAGVEPPEALTPAQPAPPQPAEPAPIEPAAPAATPVHVEPREAPGLQEMPHDVFGDISAVAVDSTVAENGTTKLTLRPNEIEALRKSGISISDGGIISEVDREKILEERDRRNSRPAKAPGLQDHAPLTATELANAKSLGLLGDEEAWKSDAKPPEDAVLPPGIEGAPTPSEPPAPSIDEQKATIAADVSRQLVAAGRPRQEAEDLGTILANRYVTRAGLFKGERGTPEELYRQESAQIRAEEIGTKLRTPAARNGADGFVERMAAGREQAQKRRNEGGSAVRVMTTAEKYAGVTEEEFNAAKSEAVEAAPELKTLMTDADWEFMASPEFHQRELFQRDQREAAPPFYSAVARTIDTAKQAKASPDQWLATIRNTPGVKGEELDLLGLEDWLKEQKGSVTKDQIADYVRANQIEVKEVEKGAGDAKIEAVNREMNTAKAEWDHLSEIALRTPTPENRTASGAAYERFRSLSEQEDALRDERDRIGGETKFGHYTLPGGENHRELLLTLPQKAPLALKTGLEIRQMPDGSWNIWDHNDWVYHEGKPSRGAVEAAAGQDEMLSKREQIDYRVPSAHGYGDPESDVNRLAHIFMDDRTIDGKRTLLIKEAQSDWHAKGRHEGYTSGYEQEGKKFYEAIPNSTVPWNELTQPQRDIFIREGANRTRGAVPDAPFKTTWQELIMKRMIRYAAEHGYEQLAWVTGEERAARYDISKEVEKIRVAPEGENRNVTVYTKTGVHASATVDKDGTIIQGYDAFRDAVGKPLSDAIGKEMADKILKTESVTELAGEGLKVGGRMHRLLYDEQFPQAANKLGKKFGARVERQTVPVDSTPRSFGYFVDWATDHGDARSRSTLGQAWSRGLNDPMVKRFMEDTKAEPVHTLPITDKLRDAAVEQGFPLFQGAKQGGIVLNPAHFAGRNYLGVEGVHPLMRLMKSANASTGIHEFGHQFLAELLRDADHELAPEQLRADAKTVLDWLKAKREDFDYAGRDKKILNSMRDKHEKFARGFEQYMRKGEAPSPELASVFARFREWLLSLYHTIKGLGKPISPAMQDVFDRLLVIEPKRVPAAKGAPETFADRHEAAGRSAAPETSHETRETLRTESDNIASRHLPPESQDARLEGIAASADRRAPGGPELDRDGNATGPQAGGYGTGQEPGAIGAGEGEAGPSGAAAPSEKPGPTVTTKPPEGSHAKFDEEKAGNIVLRNVPQEGFGDPETFSEFVKQSAARNNNFMAERRGVISDAEAMIVAQSIGKDLSFIDRKKIGEAWTKEEILAIEKIFNERTAKLRDAAIKAKTGNAEDALSFELQKQELQMMADTVQGKASAARAEAGRSLQAYSALARMRKRAAETDAASAFKEITGLTLFQSKLQARFAAGLEDPAQMALFVDASRNKGFWHAVVEYYINALISGPVTHARYAAGNMLKILVTPLIEIPVGAAVGKVRDITGAGQQADRVYLGEVAPALYGIMKGGREGLWKAWDALQTGVSEPLPGELISPHFMTPGGAIPGPIGTVIRTPGRSVTAIHTLFKMATYEMGIQRLAYRTAMNEGLDGQALVNRVADLTVRPTSTMMTQATRGALKELFMSPSHYDSLSSWVNRKVNTYPAIGIPVKIMIPFMKVGMEITREAFIERTPIGLASTEVRKNLSFKGGDLGKGEGAAFDEQMAKQITGIALVGMGVGLTLEGLMTGDGPEDPEKRNVWLRSHNPNHITIGDISIPYQGLGGLGMLLRFSANMTHTAQGWNDEEGGTLAWNFLQGFTKSVLDENFMRGIKDLLDAVYHGKEYGPAYIRQFATAWLPFSSFLGQMNRTQTFFGIPNPMADPYQRETDTIFQAAQAKTPWLSRLLMPKYDFFGEPIPNDASEGVSRYKDDPVMKAMNEVQIGVGKLKDEIKGVDLTDQQFADLSKMAGRMAKMRLDRLVRSPGFDRMPPQMRINLIHKNINDARNFARSIIQAQNPQITRAARDNKIGKLTGTVRPNQKPVQVPVQ